MRKMTPGVQCFAIIGRELPMLLDASILKSQLGIHLLNFRRGHSPENFHCVDPNRLFPNTERARQYAFG